MTGSAIHCRLCSAPLDTVFVDLGSSPLANSYLDREALFAREAFYPLVVYVCGACLLVQLPEAVAAEEIFSEYSYFSSFSDTWLEHARRYAEAVASRFGLGPSDLVIEVASNDGYLLQNFVRMGVPVLGIEPAANVARAAIEKGIPTEVRFFGRSCADDLVKRGRRAKLIVANNVLAHVPALTDFVDGLRTVLASDGVITIEVPHLLALIQEGQFDTIYHEHYSYFSLHVLRTVMATHGLRLFDVECVPTHGGSLRIFAAHTSSAFEESERVSDVLRRERQAGLDTLGGHQGFSETVVRIKSDLLSFLIEARREGKRVAAYGAPAKGNTLLNYCGIRTDYVGFTVDRSPHKQGLHLPGSRIPIHAPSAIDEARPDYLLILPWNLRSEIVEQTSRIRAWGGRWVVAVPRLEVFD